MFIRSNGKIRLTNETYSLWFFLANIWYPGIASVLFIIYLIWENSYFLSLMGFLVFLMFLVGCVLFVSDKRRKEDTGAYDGLVSVIGATEDHPKQVIFRLYGGPEALDTADSVSFKVDHGVIPIVEFDDDVEDEEDTRK